MNDYPKPVTFRCTEKILYQMNNSLYKIVENNNEFQICFFCHIKYKNENIPVIVANGIINKNKIKISINNEIKTVEFENAKYINKDHNLSIIQIKNNKDNKINFIEIDDNLYQKDSKLNFNNETIYNIIYNNENDISVSYGVIKEINKSEIIYLSNLNSLNKYSYIFNLSNNKLLGIHQTNSKYYKKGFFFKFIINKFINEYKHPKNEINIEVKIDKEDIEKDIYFIGKSDFIDEDGIKHNNDYLNKLNTELFINDKKYDYKKYFKPEKEGKYNIKLLIFNINLTDCSYMFAECQNIISINFFPFNTRYAINMKYMFNECKSLRTLDLSSFDTKNVTDMIHMFCNCKNLDILDLSSFNTCNVTNMSNMFYNCKNLNKLKLSNFDTKNITDISLYSYKDLNDLNKKI